jgi:hypothetical protein
MSNLPYLPKESVSRSADFTDSPIFYIIAPLHAESDSFACPIRIFGLTCEFGDHKPERRRGMRAKGIWTIQSFITCFIINAILLGVFYFVAEQVLRGLHQWVDPFLAAAPPNLPEDIRPAFSNLNQFLSEAERYLIPAVFGVGGLFTLLLWVLVMFQGRGLVNRVQRDIAAAPAPSRETGREGKKARREEAKSREQAPPQPLEQIPPQPSPQPAVQMLSILQREGRLIDFLQEDLSLYEDAQIGAAVRSIHQGCKDALSEHVDLKPIFEQAEGSDVTVPSGFDSRAIRLTGNVSGDPPFKGVIRHRGWRVAKIELPQPTSEQKKDWVVAPAEVEVGE